MVAQRRELVTPLPGPRSNTLHERRVRAVSAGVGAGLPIYIDEASGAVLRDVDGLSTEETAESLGLSIPAVKSRLLRARLQLREKLTRQFKRKGEDAFAYL